MNNELIQPAATLAAALLTRNTAPSFTDIANSFEVAYNALRAAVQHIESEESQRGGVVEPL